MIMAILGALAKAAMASKPQQQQGQPAGLSGDEILGAFRNPGMVNGGNLPLPVEDRGVPNLLQPPQPYTPPLGPQQTSALMPDRNPYRRRDNAITGQSV